MDNCVWTWSHGDEKQWNDWRTIEQLDNVEIDEDHSLIIKSMGLKDNRIYGLIRFGTRQFLSETIKTSEMFFIANPNKAQ